METMTISSSDTSGKLTSEPLIVMLLALTSFVGLARTANADVTAAPSGPDHEIASSVEDVLDNVLYHRPFDWVEASVSDGRVTLSGSVFFPGLSKSITRQVEKIDGVRTVDNQVTLLPVSANDDRIRREAYRAIYSDELFNHYPRLSFIPVHILVRNGRISLHGMVNSEIESRKAELLARGETMAFSVDNHLRIERDLP